MKRKISILLVILTLITMFPTDIFAINNSEAFYEYVRGELGTEYNDAGKIASFDTYKKYKLIVFGDPWGDSKPNSIDPSISGSQRRYLGYTLNDQPYNNPAFPPDSSTGTAYEDFNYIKPNGARWSWEGIVNAEQRNHMLNSTLSGSRATKPNFTLNSIGGLEYGKLLSASTWKSQGSIYFQHKENSGKIWYLNLTTSPMVGDTLVRGDIKTPSDTYYIKADEDQVKIPVTVNANAVLSGYARNQHIKEITASFQGYENRNSKSTNVSVNSDFIATRDNYSPGTHKIKLDGTVSLSTIFNDDDSSNVNKTITLIVESQGDDPYVTTTVQPDPTEKKFEGKDIDVALTVKGNLNNYTKTSNIKEWVFYAREKEENEAIIKKEYVKTLSADTTYKFKIPASKIVGDTFLQTYIVRARVYFNERVNGSDFYDAPAETIVLVYKIKPPKPDPTPIEPGPPSGGKPPIVKIYSHKSVRAGDILPVNSNVVVDEGRKVEEYHWLSDNANGELKDSSGSIWYPVEFTDTKQVISLAVKDNEEDWGQDDWYVDVTSPTVKAGLQIEGTKKVNREVIFNNTSDAPHFYPITKSQIRIEPLFDGVDASDIKYNGSIENIDISTEGRKKSILFKKSGRYKVTLYVENSVGYNDSVSYNITIMPDLAPVAEFSISNKIYRDPYNSNKATISIFDMCYSPDGDIINKKVWKYKFDSNNDGSFSDEMWNTFYIDNEIDSTEKEVKLLVNSVGRYEIMVEVFEDFGQATMLDFIKPTDYLSSNSNQKHLLERTVNVWNIPPVTDFEP